MNQTNQTNQTNQMNQTNQTNQKKDNITIFIFHRDLRVYDNLALIEALNTSKIVYPIFIFTPQQVSSQNKFKSDTSVKFMIDSLKDLKDELKQITFYYGDTTNIISSLISNKNNLSVSQVIWSRDFTPFAIQRDTELKKMLESKNILVKEIDNISLQPLEKTLKIDKTPYKVFTPFYNNAKKIPVDKPIPISKIQMKQFKSISTNDEITLQEMENKFVKNPAPEQLIFGGRKEGLKNLNNINNFTKYNQERNFPAIPTTYLSPHLKFGTISIRETYWKIYQKLGTNNDLLKQLYWRDFYMSCIYYFPDKTYSKSITRPEMNNIKWSYSNTFLQSWKDGKTGFPLVDAGMRELNHTGFIHNRVRMVVATFLIYNLHLHWKYGEEYFSQKLIDIDVSQNQGNWRWVAGIESYSNDYYKAMSIASQTEKFDSNGIYIKKWVPELKDVKSEDLCNWEEKYKLYDLKSLGYPEPIVNSKETRKKMIENMKHAILSR